MDERDRAPDGRNRVLLKTLRPDLLERIRQDHPELTGEDRMDRAEVARYRSIHITELLEEQRGEISDLDRQVAESIARDDTLVEDPLGNWHDQRTLGERLSDGLASFGGSWSFLIVFFAIMIGWMAYNSWSGPETFDPFPFILLNLALSCLAAVQAPIIMMSQKRQEEKDRLRSENDYRVNLKAELEIRHLNEKLDYLILSDEQMRAEVRRILSILPTAPR